MPNQTLYVIGNGFDLHHGLMSKYSDFKDYLIKNDIKLYEQLEIYFGNDALWADFEETLAYLDTEQIVDECLNYLVSYSIEDWKDSYHHDYQYELQKRIDLITEKLKERFTEWILKLELPLTSVESKIPLKANSKFLNFNYTATLKKLYGISDKHILYIHNQAIDSDSTLILGHGRDPLKNNSLAGSYISEDTDPRVTEGDKILDSYFEETYKPTNIIIAENQHYFKDLKDIREIYVLGHSLSQVDLPYFMEIIKNINPKVVNWTVSIYNKKELAHHREVFNDLGIDSSLVVYSKLNRVDSAQLSLFRNEI